MPFVLIKNNVKLMLRNKWLLIALIILPLLIIELVSGSFESMMNTTYKIEAFRVGYQLADETISNEMMEQLVEQCKENGIILEAFQSADIIELVENEEVSVFIDVKQNGFTIYKTKDSEILAGIIENMVTTFFNQYKINAEIINYQLEEGLVSSPSDIENQDKQGNYMKINQLDSSPVPSAIDYYGIAEVVFFIFCNYITISAIIISERKNKIEKRMQLTPISVRALYIGKVVPCVTAIILESGLTMLISTYLYGIHWGNPVGTMIILLLTCIMVGTLSILLYSIFKNVLISIVLGYVLIFAFAFIGGSFQMYMYTTVSDHIVLLSPIYYITRTLVEFSTIGSSDYYGKTVIILVSITVLSVMSGLLIFKRKLEE